MTTASTDPAATDTAGLVRVGAVEDLQQRCQMVVSGGRHGIAVFWHEGRAYAVDNRCPHMGFPLSRGSVRGGILTCHWHHARFDLASGGTFDPFADDVQVYPTRVVDGVVWVDPRPVARDRRGHWKARLEDGLEQNLQLVIIKAVLALLDAGVPARDILEIGGRFGARYREAGWGPGLTILTALGNVLDDLAPADRPLALYHGLVHVANDCAGAPPRFTLDPLPETGVPPERVKEWVRQFVEVRDSDGAERALLTAIASGLPPARVADMLFAAATDHYFLAGGHTLDFINKSCELLDLVGWEHAADILPSTVRGLCLAQRAEEQNAWRYPVDLVDLLGGAIAQLPDLVADPAGGADLPDPDALAATLLGEDPAAIVAALVGALRDGASLTAVSGALRYAAALRMARFHTSNEFSDWITVLHTFTYCNALHAALTRAPSVELARGIFHGAGKLYLDRFLNLPAARLPDERPRADGANGHDGAERLRDLVVLFDREQQVNPAATMVYEYLHTGGEAAPLLHALGHLLLREDGEFHSYQSLEAGFATYHALKDAHPAAAERTLVAVARYLAAHAPTSRAMLQTAKSALRLQAGEDLSVAPDEE
ncbi:MAG TPA: Rieske (2Fe-2S) protein [Thermomicrobiales bacterium]|nr:Rieske (2Fe-2S) protein [Thermomicrobiales bacterium]